MQSSEKMVVAITGATGFIGSKLVQRLVAGMILHHLNVARCRHAYTMRTTCQHLRISCCVQKLHKVWVSKDPQWMQCILVNSCTCAKF